MVAKEDWADDEILYAADLNEIGKLTNQNSALSHGIVENRARIMRLEAAKGISSNDFDGSYNDFFSISEGINFSVSGAGTTAKFTNRAYHNSNVKIADSFDDGNYTLDPVWTVADGTWSATNGYLTTSNVSATISTPCAISGQTVMEMSFKTRNTGGSIVPELWVSDRTSPTGAGFGYCLEANISNNKVKFFRNDGGATPGPFYISGAYTFESNRWVKIKAERNSSNLWSVYADDTLICTGTEATYKGFNYASLEAEGGSGTWDFDNVFVGCNISGGVVFTENLSQFYEPAADIKRVYVYLSKNIFDDSSSPACEVSVDGGAHFISGAVNDWTEIASNRGTEPIVKISLPVGSTRSAVDGYTMFYETE